MDPDVMDTLVDQLVVWGIREGVVTLAPAEHVGIYEEKDGQWTWECSRCWAADGRRIGRPTPQKRESLEDEAKEHARREHGEHLFVIKYDGDTEEIQ